MNAAELNELFDAQALLALRPMFWLAIGVMALLLAGVFDGLREARGPLVLGALALAAVGELRIFASEPGLVLGGMLAADRTTAAWGLLFLVSTLFAWLFSRQYYREDKPFETEHDVLMLVTPIGMMLMAGAQDLITFFLGLELLSIPLYALAAFRRNRARSIEAGLKYFLLGAFAAALFLYGAALVYNGTGTLAFGELRSADLSGRLTGAGIALIAASLFFKISVFPFQLWVPDVYQGSPTPVTALMATGTKAAAFAFLFNMAFLLPASAALGVALVALITMAVGNLGALVQDDVKRMLAYSGIAHAGTLLLALAASLATGGELHAEAVRAALFYMGAYTFTAAGAFGLLGVLEKDSDGTTTLSSLRGLAGRRPGVAGALAVFMLSLGGIPATGGFLGKWFVFATSVRAGLLAVSIVAILLSVVALGYYLRVVVAMYMEPEGEPHAPAPRRLPTTVAASLCVALVVLMGVLPGWFLDRLA